MAQRSRISHSSLWRWDMKFLKTSRCTFWSSQRFSESRIYCEFNIIERVPTGVFAPASMGRSPSGCLLYANKFLSLYLSLSLPFNAQLRHWRYVQFHVSCATTKLQNRNETIEDSRLNPRCTTHNEYLLVFITEQNLFGIDVVIALVLSSPALEHTWGPIT